MCMYVCACVCVLLLEVDTQSQPPPPPCKNLLQTKTKRIQRRGFTARLFSRMSASAFQRLDSCSAVKQNLLVNWLGSPNFSGFWCNSMWKVQYRSRLHWKSSQTCLLSLFSSISDPGPTSRAGAERAVDFYHKGLLQERKRGKDACVTALPVCSISEMKLFGFFGSTAHQGYLLPS